MTPPALSVIPRRRFMRMARRCRAVRFSIVSITAIVGCAHAGAGSAAVSPKAGGDSIIVATRAGPIPLEVDNRSSYDVIIYAARGSLRRRIGTVAGLSRTRVNIPTTLTADLGGFSVTAVRLASRETYVSDLVSPQPGTRLRLMIQPRIVDSSLSIE